MKNRPQIGLGYRQPLRRWLKSAPSSVECLEVTAEHFFDDAGSLLESLAENYPIFVHGLGLSLGTPGPLDREVLESFARVAERANARWVSEHISFTRAGGIDLGHLNPVPRTNEMLEVLAGHVGNLQQRCGCPVLLENITTQLDPGGDLTEPDFLNELCRRSGCGVLLDVTNLFINARNLGFDAIAWLRAVQPEHIRQLHVVGYSERDGRLADHHSAAMQDDLLELIAEVIRYAPVEAVILERDEDLGDPEAIEAELEKLHRLVNRPTPIVHETAR